jgi:hypothetical protein
MPKEYPNRIWILMSLFGHRQQYPSYPRRMEPSHRQQPLDHTGTLFNQWRCFILLPIDIHVHTADRLQL